MVFSTIYSGTTENLLGLKFNLTKTLKALDIRDVRNDHEIYLANGYPGSLPTYVDCQKNNIRK